MNYTLLASYSNSCTSIYSHLRGVWRVYVPAGGALGVHDFLKSYFVLQYTFTSQQYNTDTYIVNVNSSYGPHDSGSSYPGVKV